MGKKEIPERGFQGKKIEREEDNGKTFFGTTTTRETKQKESNKVRLQKVVLFTTSRKKMGKRNLNLIPHLTKGPILFLL